jgi:hypothetical protein
VCARSQSMRLDASSWSKEQRLVPCQEVRACPGHGIAPSVKKYMVLGTRRNGAVWSEDHRDD